jgi:probable F420-dependent oxidoreductase
MSTNGALKFSTGLPNCREGRLNPIGSVDPGWLTEVTTAAEDLGYHSIWLNEFLQTDPGVKERYDVPPNCYDPMVTASLLAAHTRRIRFVTSTIVLPHHHPLLLSRQIATLDVLSGGRFTLGIGLGGSAEEYRRLRGELGRANRGAMLDEYLEALRVLWTERSATHHGTYVRFDDVEAFPKPVQEPLPIFMAGKAEGVFHRIARLGEGWIDTFMTPPEIAARVADLRRFVSQARGRAEPVEIARQFYLSLAPSDELARANHEASLPGARGPASFGPPNSEMVIIGTPDHVAARLRDYVAAGVTEICAIFFSPTAAGAIEQMTLFRDEVIPAVQATAHA